MKEKLFLGLLLSLSIIVNTYSFNIDFNVDNKNIDINDYVNVKINISTEASDEDIKEVNIKGIEDFNIISQSQSQSSQTYISVGTGSADTVSNFVNSIILTLSPKKEGEFTIGPVELIGENQTISSESINIKVNGNKKTNINKLNEAKITEEHFNKIERNEVKGLTNEYIFYFIIILLLVVLLSAIIVLYKKGKYDNIDFGGNVYGNDDDNDIKIEDFEYEEKIVYPELDDEDFIIKIEMILKSKIAKRYKIKKTIEKTYEEILLEIDDKDDYKDKLTKVCKEINKLKYSNILISKAELLDLIKQF